ncbi:MAG: GFA family protein [Paracoccaceae bacterium]|nr:GFA family protein [Paracoccaceae bacterium]MDG2258685.1 GFA family protein [Paracoccaceae bacterium]
MTEHRASCQCGAVQATSVNDPIMVAACNCVACQKKTGSAFGSGVFFKQADVALSGDTWKWTRTAESGNELTQHFCPNCGTTVFWMNAGRPGVVALSLGCIDGPIQQPNKVVWAEHQRDWLSFDESIPTSEQG